MNALTLTLIRVAFLAVLWLFVIAAIGVVRTDLNGTAAAVPGPSSAGGYGLTGMRERAELLGGRLTAGPTDRGFRVRLWLPAGRDHHPAHQPAKAI